MLWPTETLVLLQDPAALSGDTHRHTDTQRQRQEGPLPSYSVPLVFQEPSFVPRALPGSQVRQDERKAHKALVVEV